MAENTKIQWATHTFNPWRGCTKVAPGCANCYADTLSKRNPKTLGIWGTNGTRVVASESMWRKPVKWDRCAVLTCEDCGNDHMSEPAPKGVVPIENSWEFECGCGCNSYTAAKPRVFCDSLADVFEDFGGVMRGLKGGYLHHSKRWHVRDGMKYIELPEIVVGASRVTMGDVRARLFRLIDETSNLDWLLLTKRPQNVRRMTHDHWTEKVPGHISQNDGDGRGWKRRENVWPGTSIACQEDAVRNIPELLKCRDLAAKVFLSIEPLVGPVDLTPWLHLGRCDSRGGGGIGSDGRTFTYRCGLPSGHSGAHSALVPTNAEWFGKPTFDWVIVGGESGLGARSCDIAGIRSIVRQCKDAGVPVFVKQVGSMCIDNDPASRCHWPPLTEFHQNNERCRVLQKHRKGGDPAEWPKDIRVREVPS